MNPLIPSNAIQVRYVSPLYEPVYDEDDNVVDEECVRGGTDVWEELIMPVNKDRIPRYYRLRHRQNAKEHKNRWNSWIKNHLMHENYYLIKVSIIGRRVLFVYNPKLLQEREKLFKRQEFFKKKEKRIQEREAAQPDAAPSGDTWENPNANGITGFVIDDEEHYSMDYEAYYNNNMQEQQRAEQEAEHEEEERLRERAREIETILERERR